METYDEYQVLNQAIDRLVGAMAQIEPNLLRDEAREVLSEAVRKLIRSVGAVD